MSMNRWEYLDNLIARAGGGTWVPYILDAPVVALDNATKKVQPFSALMKDSQPFIWTDSLYSTDNATVQSGVDTLQGGVLVKFDQTAGVGTGGNDAWPISAIFGLASRGPREVPRPVLIQGTNTPMAGSLTNQTGGAVNVYLTFIGLKRSA